MHHYGENAGKENRSCHTTWRISPKSVPFLLVFTLFKSQTNSAHLDLPFLLTIPSWSCVGSEHSFATFSPFFDNCSSTGVGPEYREVHYQRATLSVGIILPPPGLMATSAPGRLQLATSCSACHQVPIYSWVNRNNPSEVLCPGAQQSVWTCNLFSLASPRHNHLTHHGARTLASTHQVYSETSVQHPWHTTVRSSGPNLLMHTLQHKSYRI